MCDTGGAILLLTGFADQRAGRGYLRFPGSAAGVRRAGNGGGWLKLSYTQP